MVHARAWSLEETTRGDLISLLHRLGHSACTVLHIMVSSLSFNRVIKKRKKFSYCGPGGGSKRGAGMRCGYSSPVFLFLHEFHTHWSMGGFLFGVGGRVLSFALLNRFFFPFRPSYVGCYLLAVDSFLTFVYPRHYRRTSVLRPAGWLLKHLCALKRFHL